MVWSNGDNESFSSRGLATFMMHILWQIGITLYPTLIQKVRLMLQVNEREMPALKYYTKRGFVPKTKIPESITTLDVDGQYIHWCKDVGLKFMVLYHPPCGTSGALAPVLGLKEMINLSPSNNKKRRNNRTKRGKVGEEDTGELHNTKNLGRLFIRSQ